MSENKITRAATDFKAKAREFLPYIRVDIKKIPKSYHDEIAKLDDLTSGITSTTPAAARMLHLVGPLIDQFNGGMLRAKNPKAQVPVYLGERQPEPIPLKVDKKSVKGVEMLGNLCAEYERARAALKADGISDLTPYL